MSTKTELLDPAAANEPSLAGKYLAFTLGGESYGMPVLRVREIIRHNAITTVPGMPEYLKGVLNLRGQVIPIVDLRVKFKLARADIGERACIVVVQASLAAGSRVSLGFIVDGVESVANVAAKDIEPTPDFGGRLNTEHILGMAKLDGRVVTLLDIDKVMMAEQVEPT